MRISNAQKTGSFWYKKTHENKQQQQKINKTNGMNKKIFEQNLGVVKK